MLRTEPTTNTPSPSSSSEQLDSNESKESTQQLASYYYRPSESGSVSRSASEFCLGDTFYSTKKALILGEGAYGLVRSVPTILMPDASKEVAVKKILLNNITELKKAHPTADEKELQDANRKHIHLYYKNTLREAEIFRSRYGFCQLFYNQSQQSMRLVMPKLPGKRLCNTTFNNEYEFLAAFINIMREVQYFHELGYLHGDLNLRNILLHRDQSLQAFLCDFGFSRHLGQPACPLWNKNAYYLHPYLATQHPIASRELDTFSLGQIIYAFITNKITAPQSAKNIIKEHLAEIYQGMTNAKLKEEKWETKGYDSDPSKIWPLEKAITETIKVYNALLKDQQDKHLYDKVEEYKISQAPILPFIDSKTKTMKVVPDHALLPLELPVDIEAACKELDLVAPVVSTPVDSSKKPRPGLLVKTSNLVLNSEGEETDSFRNSPVFAHSMFWKTPVRNRASSQDNTPIKNNIHRTSSMPAKNRINLKQSHSATRPKEPSFGFRKLSE